MFGDLVEEGMHIPLTIAKCNSRQVKEIFPHFFVFGFFHCLLSTS